MLKALVREAVHEVLQAQTSAFLGAEPEEPTTGRNGYRAGYYSRELITRAGKIELRVARRSRQREWQRSHA